jgi:hypothetical protein
VTLAAALTAAAAPGGGNSGSNGGSSGYVVALVPLAGGLVHVLQHTTISQVKLVAAGGGGGCWVVVIVRGVGVVTLKHECLKMVWPCACGSVSALFSVESQSKQPKPQLLCEGFVTVHVCCSLCGCIAAVAPCPALQLRLKCLETLLQALTLIQADTAATAAFKAAAAPTASQQQVVDSSSSLSVLVSSCLSGVSASDPSAAHKALAAQAAAVLQKMA